MCILWAPRHSSDPIRRPVANQRRASSWQWHPSRQASGNFASSKSGSNVETRGILDERLSMSFSIVERSSCVPLFCLNLIDSKRQAIQWLLAVKKRYFILCILAGKRGIPALCPFRRRQKVSLCRQITFVSRAHVAGRARFGVLAWSDGTGNTFSW